MEIQQTAARREAETNATTVKLDEAAFLADVLSPTAPHAKDQLEEAPDAGDPAASESCLECVYRSVCEWVQWIVDCLRPLFNLAPPVDHTGEITQVRNFVRIHCNNRPYEEEYAAWMETFNQLPEAAQWAVMEACVGYPEFRRAMYAEFKNSRITSAFGLSAFDIYPVIKRVMPTSATLHLDARIALNQWLQNPQFAIPAHAPFTDHHYVCEFLQDWNTDTFHVKTSNEFGGDDIGEGWKETYRHLPEEVRQACFDAVVKAHPELIGTPPPEDADEQQKLNYRLSSKMRVDDHIYFLVRNIDVMKTVTAWEVDHRPAKKESAQSSFNEEMARIEAFLKTQGVDLNQLVKERQNNGT